MPTRTRTVVFTDMANYTASVERTDREGLRNLIAAHEQTVAPVLTRHGGRVVKTLGDSFMVLFDSATDAVRAGVDLVERVSGTSGFAIRVGMATGDVEEIEQGGAFDCFGEPVNLASRVMSKTPPTEVWFSQGTLLSMNQAEIAWEAVGRYQLRGIAGEVEVFRAVPSHVTTLPEAVTAAVRAKRLVRIKRGEPVPPLPPNPVILLEGFAPGSNALKDLVDGLPVVDPACLWLLAYNIAPSDRYGWEKLGRSLIIGQPIALERAISAIGNPTQAQTGSDTIILDVGSRATMDLVMSGLALPSVPLSEVVAGYTYDLLADGRWVNRSENAIARADVSADGVSFVSLTPGLTVSGRQTQPGKPVILKDKDDIRTPSGTMRYLHVGDKGYLGLLVSDTLARLGVAPGQQAEIGREPNHPGLALPDRRGNENIRWCLGARAARARTGGFTLDRALAGRRQAVITLAANGAKLVSLHDRCPTYVFDNEHTDLDLVVAPRTVVPGDLIVTGTSVIAVREPGA